LWRNAESLYRMKAELVATDQEWDARIGKADAFVDGAMALNQRAQQHATAAQKWLSPLEPPPPPKKIGLAMIGRMLLLRALLREQRTTVELDIR
jgi:hypothetical protein